MLRALALGLLAISFSISVSGENDFVGCSCEDDGFWSIQNLRECQRVSDFLIAIAYFSIPLELLYFVSCSNFPFKWVFLQFIAFIVLCGLTHLLNGWTYYGPHLFHLILWLTIAKFATALVSCATAITLLTLIPLLLKWKVRELYLTQNVLELNQEVGMMKKQKEASMHVRMLTREIRKSLDKNTILNTTLVELSKILDLQCCLVWMPNESRTQMFLTHEVKHASSLRNIVSVPINDPDVLEIRETKGVKILRPDTALVISSCSESEESGAVAAIRIPMLHGSNFKGGTPEFVDTCYAVLVLVSRESNSRAWNCQEMEIVEVVADQVAVALSHATVLEESQLMRGKLSMQNRILQQAKNNATMASQARTSCQKVMSHGMRRPMHSILGLLSMLQSENLHPDQKIIIDTLAKTSTVLSTLINDVIETSAKDSGKSPVEIRRFSLRSMIREASCVAKCLCVYRGYGFEINVQSSIPDIVMGDQKRVFQLILYMLGYLLDMHDGGKTVTLRVLTESNSQDRNRQEWRSHLPDDYISIRFEVEVNERVIALYEGSTSTTIRHLCGGRYNSNGVKEGLSFGMCKKLAQMMQGKIWISRNSLGRAQSMTLVIRFQTRPSIGRAMMSHVNPPGQPGSFRGLRVTLVDDDDVNRIVTKKLLEKLGCEVMALSSGFECLTVLTQADISFRVVLLDLHMPEMDGFEVAVRIRKFCGPSWPVIIALTASAVEDIRERCLQLGMNGIIQKPILLHQMADELHRVLQLSGD